LIIERPSFEDAGVEGAGNVVDGLFQTGSDYRISLGPFEQQSAGDDLAAGVVFAALLGKRAFHFARTFESLSRFETNLIDLFL
jgi:hypothetical protein